MKKILNDPTTYVDEMLAGLVAAHPEYYAQPEPRVIARPGGAKSGKVGIVTGGGSGHLPVFTGYVGNRELMDGVRRHCGSLCGEKSEKREHDQFHDERGYGFQSFGPTLPTLQNPYVFERFPSGNGCAHS